MSKPASGVFDPFAEMFNTSVSARNATDQQRSLIEGAKQAYQMLDEDKVNFFKEWVALTKKHPVYANRLSAQKIEKGDVKGYIWGTFDGCMNQLGRFDKNNASLFNEQGQTLQIEDPSRLCLSLSLAPLAEADARQLEKWLTDHQAIFDYLPFLDETDQQTCGYILLVMASKCHQKDALMSFLKTSGLEKAALSFMSPYAEELHTRLLNITTKYLEHLKRAEAQYNGQQLPALLLQKILDVTKINTALQSSNDKALFDKIDAIQKVKTLLEQNETISEYRGPDWRRYLRNMGVALACFIFPIGVTAAVISKCMYNTFEFWKPTGYKEKELLLTHINNASLLPRPGP